MAPRFGALPFPIALALIGGVTVLVVWSLVVLAVGSLWPIGLLVPVALAGWYLWEYRERPGPNPRTAADEDDEEFEDPVMIATSMNAAEPVTDPERDAPEGGSSPGNDAKPAATPIEDDGTE